MRLSPGSRLGPYEIVAPLGAGGMGEVYRARDPRLGREVAIKVLPADRLADAERRRRFTQEARAASALNHPHIVTIHEIEVAEGIDFLVMEAVPGKTLDLLIPKQGMPVPELLRVAIPIADALTAAHAHGIVHRDLKPANVIVAPPRTVKVVDFGLAELDGARTDGDGPETLTLPPAPDRSTAGTPPYMSPEQAAGRALDGRSDIFSFGAVLYEMATGRRAFERASVAETLAAVLHEEPRPPRELAPALPASLERLILRCLKKDPDRRFQHASDLKVELEDVRDESAARGAGSTPRSRRVLVLAAAAVLVAAAAVATASRWSWSALPAPTVVQITSEQRAGSGSFSPDGTQVAFSSVGEGSSSWNIWLTIVGEADARRLTSDAKADAFPTWSPDGKQIAFIRYRTKLGRGQFFSYFEAGDIHLVSPLGGSARRLSDFPARLQLAWSPDGRWLAAARARSGHEPPGGIHLISVATGESRALTFPQPPNFDLSPSFSPDGRTLAYASCGGIEEFPMCDVSVLPVDSALQPRQKPQRLTTQRLLNAGIAWTPDGRSIVYGAGIDLWRVRSDGSAAPEPMQVPGRGGFPTTVRGQSRLAFIRPTGLADIYRLELGRTPRPVLESSYPDVFPQYSPDGRQIAFESGRAGGKREVWIADADGANPVRLTRGPGRYQGSPRWSPDGRVIAFDSHSDDGGADIWAIGVDGLGLRQVTHDRANNVVPSFSRDGRFIYFASNRTGRSEVWRVAVAGGAEEQITRAGGIVPFESFDGRTLYYLRAIGGGLVARPTAGGAEKSLRSCVPFAGWAVSRRGLVFADCSEADAPSGLHSLRLWDESTGQDRALATLETDWIGGVSVSPDGRTIIFGRTRATSDLMMIDHFN